LSRRALLAIAGIGAVAVVALQAFAWQPAIPPVPPPAPSSFAPELVAKGEVLAEAGNCVACHTAHGGKLAAGGRPFPTGIGTFYSTNITPDPATGIGDWSEAAFHRALREGVARDGRLLFPVFPYDHFTKLTDADIRALYAYFMTRPAVQAADRPNTVPFPLDVRALQALWKAIYFKRGPYQPDPGRDAQWNRGAYLAEGLAACGACHTARNALGAEQVGHPYGGALFDGSWVATPLDVSPSPARWSEAEFFTYLRTGESPPHGVALGPMRTVIKDLAKLPDSDLKAIAAYFISLNRPSGADPAPSLAKATNPLIALRPLPPISPNEREGLPLYSAHCAACHEAGSTAPGAARSPLPLTAPLWLELRPQNVVHTVLDGIDGNDGLPGAMPGFRDKLNDEEVSAVIKYVRALRTNALGWPDLLKDIAKIRAKAIPQP
jgi:mono/diheme cytochrome c family protein